MVPPVLAPTGSAPAPTPTPTQISSLLAPNGSAPAPPVSSGIAPPLGAIGSESADTNVTFGLTSKTVIDVAHLAGPTSSATNEASAVLGSSGDVPTTTSKKNPNSNAPLATGVVLILLLFIVSFALIMHRRQKTANREVLTQLNAASGSSSTAHNRLFGSPTRTYQRSAGGSGGGAEGSASCSLPGDEPVASRRQFIIPSEGGGAAVVVQMGTDGAYVQVGSDAVC